MPRSIPAKVKPELLVWARESAHLSLQDAAKKLTMHSSLLEEWETGDQSISIAQVRKLGEVYKRPLAVFFLPEAPQGFDAQREFRRFAGATPQAASPELMLAIRNASYQRSNAIELKELLSEPTEALPERLHPGMDAETGGELIRRSLGIPWFDQLQGLKCHCRLRRGNVACPHPSFTR